MGGRDVERPVARASDRAGRRTAVSVLGATTVDGEPVTQGQRALLSALALHRDGADTQTLADAVSGGRLPPLARQSLERQIGRVRAQWGPDLIVTGGADHRLTASIDVDLVDAVADRWLARPADPRAVTDLRSAVSSFRGTPFADLPESAGVGPERARLEELRVRLIEHLAVCRMVGGDARQAAVELATLTETDPYREHGWALLMVALQRSGRRNGALAAYERAASILRRELGAEPSPELQRLRDEVDGDGGVGRLFVPLPAAPRSRRGSRTLVPRSAIRYLTSLRRV